MTKSKLTEEEIEEILSNENVVDVSADGSRIYYTETFKRYFVRECLKGESPVQIFKRSGLDPEIIGNKRIERCTARWKDMYGDVFQAYGKALHTSKKTDKNCSEDGSEEEIRTKSSRGRKKDAPGTEQVMRQLRETRKLLKIAERESKESKRNLEDSEKKAEEYQKEIQRLKDLIVKLTEENLKLSNRESPLSEEVFIRQDIVLEQAGSDA